MSISSVATPAPVSTMAGLMGLSLTSLEEAEAALAYEVSGMRGLSSFLVGIQDKSPAPCLTDAQRALISDSVLPYCDSELSRLQRSLRDIESTLNNYYEAWCDYQSKAYKAQLAIDNHVPKKNTFYKAIDTILRDNAGVSFVGASDGYVTLATPPITMSLNNDGIAPFVELGSFHVSIKYDGRCEVLRGENNTLVDQYYHPHINREGAVCLGDLASVYKSAVKEARPDKYFKGLLALLRTYNAESPYKSLAEFKRGQVIGAGVDLSVLPQLEEVNPASSFWLNIDNDETLEEVKDMLFEGEILETCENDELDDDGNEQENQFSIEVKRYNLVKTTAIDGWAIPTTNAFRVMKCSDGSYKTIQELFNELDGVTW